MRPSNLIWHDACRGVKALKKKKNTPPPPKPSWNSDWNLLPLLSHRFPFRWYTMSVFSSIYFYRSFIFHPTFVHRCYSSRIYIYVIHLQGKLTRTVNNRKPPGFEFNSFYRVQDDNYFYRWLWNEIKLHCVPRPSHTILKPFLCHVEINNNIDAVMCTCVHSKIIIIIRATR